MHGHCTGPVAHLCLIYTNFLPDKVQLVQRNVQFAGHFIFYLFLAEEVDRIFYSYVYTADVQEGICVNNYSNSKHKSTVQDLGENQD